MDASPIDLIDAAVAGGFDSIGLRIVAPTESDVIVPVVGDEPMLRRIESRLSDSGITILDVEAIWLSPRTDPGAFPAIAETGARLGAGYVLAIGNDPEPQRQRDNFARLAESARDVGLAAMMEFIPYCQVKTLAEARDLARATGVPGAGVIVDALHLRRSGGTIADLATLAPDELQYIQLCDARAEAPPPDRLRAEARGDRLYPGDGALDLHGLLRALPASLPISVEAPSAAHASLPAAERARLCADRTRRVLAELS
ncbi:MAG: sugar phosphate isomerase/epimerase [Reyranellaceae bacterium]